MPIPPAQAPRAPLQGSQLPKPTQTAGQAAQASYGRILGAKADCIYGATKTTKTSRLGDAAEYLHDKYKAPSRLVSADTGGWEVIQDVVDAGLIQPFALIPSRRNFYETLERLTLGWWPKDVHDPQSDLVPPANNGIAEIAGMFFEGLTSFAELFMYTNLTDLQGVNVPRSEQEKLNMITSGTFRQRFASQTDYGSIQMTIASRVRDSGFLPVKKVIWTALEQRGEDDKGKVVYGPDIIGKKATGQCGSWFGSLIHLDFITVKGEIQDPTDPAKKIVIEQPKPFMFLRNHVDPLDPLRIPWPAGTRALRNSWMKVPNVMKPDLKEFYLMMDKLVEEEKAAKASLAK
jgi:hypothetical protein